MPKFLALATLALLAGCAQPAPFFPQPPAKPPVAAVEPAATPAPRTASGDVRLVGGRKDEPACAGCWTLPEILAALTAAVVFALALVRLYRRRNEKGG